jgi:RNA polymerase primary sigma factor
VSQSLRKIERERQRLSAELGAEPTPEQLAHAIGLSPKKLHTLMQSSQELLSLDMSVGESGGMTLGGLIRDPDRNADPEDVMLGREVIEELHRIMLELNEREQRVMSMRFKLDGSEPPHQDEVAKELKLSRERVRQIELQAIKKLRLLAQRRRLREIMPQ